ncbi:MAG: hypothetical protein HEP71_09990 [Roseivirga sp.]|nr:hypothetical protein [Roseivirga sp.]
MDIEDIWSGAASQGSNIVFDRDIKSKSGFELGYFKRILMAEIVVTAIIALVLLLSGSVLEAEVRYLLLTTTMLGGSFSYYGYWKVGTIDLTHNNRIFLKRSISFLRAFSNGLIVLTGLLLIVTDLTINYMKVGSITLRWFVEDGSGQLLLLLSISIICSVSLYVRQMYGRRMRNLSEILKAMKEGDD